MVRAGERRDAAAEGALAGDAPPDAALARMLSGYIGFAQANGHLIGLLGSEVDQLPDRYRRRCAHAQREYVHLWVRLLENARPGVDASDARVAVAAVLSLVDHVVRFGAAESRADLGPRLAEIGSAVLATV
jgi:hypothetical protein